MTKRFEAPEYQKSDYEDQSVSNHKQLEEPHNHEEKLKEVYVFLIIQQID